TWDGAAGKTLNQKATQLNLKGDTKLYASRFHGRLLGIPVTFTPDFPPPLVLPWMSFSDVEVTLVYMTSNELSAKNFKLKAA
nr:hypothetical protein [Longispora sp. (in: high G+C Gram-positive bacteria)]